MSKGLACLCSPLWPQALLGPLSRSSAALSGRMQKPPPPGSLGQPAPGRKDSLKGPATVQFSQHGGSWSALPNASTSRMAQRKPFQEPPGSLEASLVVESFSSLSPSLLSHFVEGGADHPGGSPSGPNAALEGREWEKTSMYRATRAYGLDTLAPAPSGRRSLRTDRLISENARLRENHT